MNYNDTVETLRSISRCSSEEEAVHLEELLFNPESLSELFLITEDNQQGYVIRGLASRYFTQYCLNFINRLSNSDCKLVRNGVEYGKETVEFESSFICDFFIKNGHIFADIAVWNNDIKMLRFILDNSVVATNRDYFCAAITQAARIGNYEAFKMLQDEGVQFNQWWDVVRGGSLEILKSIPDFIKKRPECIEDAIFSDKIEILTWLADNGAELTPEHLGLASSRHDLKMVSVIFDRIKNLTHEDINKAIDCASSHIENYASGSEIIKYLINQTGVKATKFSVERAAIYGDVDLLKFLFQHGGGDKDGEALYQAAIEWQWESVLFLLENGSPFKQGNEEAHGALKSIQSGLGMPMAQCSVQEVIDAIKIKLVHQE